MVVLATVLITVGGIIAMVNTPLDAIPDLSDVQVIVYTEYAGQAPQVVEDQVTYPLTTAMLSVPFAKVVRGPKGSPADSGHGRYRCRDKERARGLGLGGETETSAAAGPGA